MKSVRTGLLRYVVLRANADGKVLVALVTGRESWPEAESLARELAAACPAALALSTTSTARAETPCSARRSAFFSLAPPSKTPSGPARVSPGAASFASSNRLVAGRAYHDIGAAAARWARSIAWSTPMRARVALPCRWRRWRARWWLLKRTGGLRDRAGLSRRA